MLNQTGKKEDRKKKRRRRRKKERKKERKTRQIKREIVAKKTVNRNRLKQRTGQNIRKILSRSSR